MTTLGFTGTRQFTAEHLRLIDPLCWEWMESFSAYVTGGCRGFDAIIGETLAARWPDRLHMVIVPANVSQVDPWWEKRRCPTEVTVIRMPEGTNYRDRNLEIVKASLELFYAAHRPEYHGSQIRSGTWQTVRLARAQSMFATGVVLDDTVSTSLL